MNNRSNVLDLIASALNERNVKESKSEVIRNKYLNELARYIFERSGLTEGDTDDKSILGVCDAFFLAVSEKGICLSEHDLIILSEMLSEMPGMCKKCDNNDLSVFSLESKTGYPRQLAYVKNHFSNEAFKRFDEVIGRVRSEYCDTFETAANGVYYGQYSGCILPFEATWGNVMNGIMNIVSKYGLKKSLVCNISMPDSGVTKFGIFTREMIFDNDNDMLDISMEKTDFFSLAGIANAAKRFGFANGYSSKISSDSEERCIISLSGNKRSQFKMILFLTISGFRFDVTGSYKIIN